MDIRRTVRHTLLGAAGLAAVLGTTLGPATSAEAAGLPGQGAGAAAHRSAGHVTGHLTTVKTGATKATPSHRAVRTGLPG